MSFSSSAFDDHELLSVDHEQTLKTHVPFPDVGSSSAMLPCRGGVCSEREVYTGKHIVQRKPEHSMQVLLPNF